MPYYYIVFKRYCPEIYGILYDSIYVFERLFQIVSCHLSVYKIREMEGVLALVARTKHVNEVATLFLCPSFLTYI